MGKLWTRLLVLNDPYAMRINRELATEIGFNESIVLLQLEYLISTSKTEEKDGQIWTYQSLTNLQQFFPWWGLATISRIVKSLEAKSLITIGHFNKISYDRTQWFTLNEEGINKLKSIRLVDGSIFQNEKSKRSKRKMDTTKMKNGIDQNETTIPKTPAKNPTKELTPQQKIIGVLARVTGMDLSLNAGRLGKRGKELISAGYTPEQVDKLYGPGGWWYTSHWKGQKGELPSPELIEQTIKQAAESIQLAPKSNGHRIVKAVLSTGEVVEVEV